MKRAVNVLAIMITLAFTGCAAVQTGGPSSYGGFKVIDGERGQPSRIYYTKVARQSGIGATGVSGVAYRQDIVFDQWFISKFGTSYVISSDRGGNSELHTSFLTFTPIGSSQTVQIKGGTQSNRQYTAHYLPAPQFEKESTMWLQLIGNRSTSEGVSLEEFESIVTNTMKKN